MYSSTYPFNKIILKVVQERIDSLELSEEESKSKERISLQDFMDEIDKEADELSEEEKKIISKS